MPFAISAICWYQYPKLFGGKQNSRTDLGNVLPSSWKLNRIPRKCIQMLVDICGRAHLSRNSLVDCVFIDFKKSQMSPRQRRPNHTSSKGERGRRWANKSLSKPKTRQYNLSWLVEPSMKSHCFRFPWIWLNSRKISGLLQTLPSVKPWKVERGTP